MTLVDTVRTAATAVPILEVLAERWSPRAFDPRGEVEDAAIDRALEAARWTPSANNSQPWRFVVARRGSPTFHLVHGSLAGVNRTWADKAAVLVVSIAEVADADGRPRPWSHYDLGQSVAYLTAQVHHDGLHAHQMAGFDTEALRAALSLPPRLDPVTVVAVGPLGDADALPEPLRERERAPRQRRAVTDLVLHRDPA
ncbi:nitroreductase family protein [Ornithinimicrobium sediminis]|uniref:nitroreductase family protein n=1 Tax=Ornithinimicrobium sediminis TaxID=2904603 RepID=UPI001E4D0FC3|nr:nitroreductase family protein [Ornithinimicrobium sediminis]MCE0486715.1 nitroreductase family protein [Ornithinimicrobium sediminis]